MVSLAIIHTNPGHDISYVLHAVSRSTVLPHEVIVLSTLKRRDCYNVHGLNIRSVQVAWLGRSKATRSTAIGEALKQSKHSQLIVMDGSCVPHATCIETMLTCMDNCSGLVTCSPRVLMQSIKDRSYSRLLENQSEEHPHITAVETDCEQTLSVQFSDMCFGVRRGLNTCVIPYPSDYDTSVIASQAFAQLYIQADLPIVQCPARVYHNQESNNWTTEDVVKLVADSNYFFEKYDIWPQPRHLHELSIAQRLDWHPLQSKPITLMATQEWVATTGT